MKRHILILMAIAFAFSSVLTSCDKGKDGDEDGNGSSTTGVTLSQITLSLLVGENETLIATVSPSDATDKSLTWTSSNTSVATVDNSGKVTGVAEGSATITVKTTNGGYMATCAVTVESADPRLTVTFGSSTQWTAGYIDAIDVTSSGYNYVDITADFMEGYYPYIYFFVPTEVGTTSDDFLVLYFEDGYVEIDGTTYGDWYPISGTATVSKYSKGKISGTLSVTMYDLDDSYNNGNENPERRLLTITFENIDVENATKAAKAFKNTIEKGKALKDRKLFIQK